MGQITPTKRLFWIPLLLHPVYPGHDAKQDVSVLANPLRRPGITRGFSNDNTNSQFYLTSKNPDERAEENRIHTSSKKHTKIRERIWSRPCDVENESKESTPAQSSSLEA
ncbi:hypothetical protein KHC33_13910 [Methanospirillum sp. J.3.6.1-F.2.7.3]|uniref:Uncharacterized protein n=1 Tax=Methanospirillum purgamenti TaxID=2834276 RepID=A0A8E7AZM0_9EURY|nr:MULTISPECIES: hypothetical protein [Methanospirillum]MDX8551264.1 hypothetical protein [Methanospirillum hungatei]QVV88406.1 hypothetical protein KHC33_13910 [Methanospirillum sp. J.3.6.1-F.2.7.3]